MGKNVSLITLLCLSFVQSPSACSAQDEVPLDQAIEMIRSRFESIPALDAQVEVLTTNDPEGNEYFKASETYRRALYSHVGLQPAESKGDPPLGEPHEEHFRLRLRSDECLRIDQLDLMDSENVVAYWIYKGQHWESYIELIEDRFAPSVTVDETLVIPTVQVMTGLGAISEFDTPTYFHTGDAREILRWDEFFLLHQNNSSDSEAADRKTISNIRSTIDTTTGDLLISFDFDRNLIECTFRKEFNYAVSRIDAKLQPGKAMGNLFSAEWTEFTKVDEEQDFWFPELLRIERKGRMVIVPEGGFKAKNPSLKPSPADPNIDKSVLESKDFLLDVQVCKIKVSSTSPVDCEYTNATYAKGTIIEDRRSGEVFQLTGVSDAVDAKLKRAILTEEDLLATAPAVPAKGWRVGIVLVNLVVGLIILIYFFRNSRKVKA